MRLSWGPGAKSPVPDFEALHSRNERNVMDDWEVQRLKEWALQQVEWEKAIAKHRGKRRRYIKNGRFMRAAVRAVLQHRHKTPEVRAKAAVKIIHKHVKETYKI
jgi:hypothetical protein